MRIEQIKESFNIDVGAPSPVILSNEHCVYISFYIQKIDPDFDGTNIHMRSNEDEGIKSIKFINYAQFKFGSPNDEAINGHPYYNLGLEPYSIQEVIDSDWIEQLRIMNSVHPYHNDVRFKKYRHFIFFFHDTCFEIVCENYEVLEENCTNMTDEINRISALI